MNSTYMMLQAAIKFKKAFDVLESDANYTKYFDEERSNGKNIDGPPTHVDWDQAEAFVGFLKTFYDMTLKISGSLYVTSNTFFQEMCEIHAELNKLAKEPNSMIGSMTVSMRRKYGKYWGYLEKFNQLLFIATILDPRCKLELLKVGLYECYKEMMTPPLVSPKDATQPRSQSALQTTLGTSKPVPSIFRARLMQETQVEKNDLVDYLNDRCEDLTNDDFDILNWWKLNENKFKIVSQIAKDVLAIQISTVAPESAFSTSGRILDPFRSSLSAKMVEAVICTKNWLHNNKEPIVIRQYLDEVDALDDSEKAIEDNESWVTTGDVLPISID
ncbi:zinc finger BED domain-containing protein RICESLEEPER 2-like [Olea europaea var. sylvestris]|uniref:zinc finger BED domain-containing protein RICESLEEPER 2-like n=1 Tax=Olea europaea var. sylvestris TaxID=158386 RepID=UPI000C1D84A4|nr:zinc finger BED domain-containing protein RICESLEEPER 2-like [Olea europaea var. sylvestris]